jgi:hypothetical protein
MAQCKGTGMFPRDVMNRFPLLPLEEEGRPWELLSCVAFAFLPCLWYHRQATKVSSVLGRQ